MSLNCGSDITHANCKGLILPMTEDGGKLFMGELVSYGTILYTIVLAAASADPSFSIGMVKAINALRCAMVSGYYNVWMLLGVWYYVSRHFWLESIPTGYI